MPAVVSQATRAMFMRALGQSQRTRTIPDIRRGAQMYVGPAPGLRADGDANGLWPAIGDDERRA